METSVLEAWQAIDLVNVQQAWDDQAAQVVDFREACISSRKELALKTKAFKKKEEYRKAPESSMIRTDLPKLLRLYQEEVDRLTQRSKFAENCFLAMYRLIREAPDPSSELAEASKATFETQMAASKLEQQLAEKSKEIQHLKQELEQLQQETERLTQEQTEQEERLKATRTEEQGKNGEENYSTLQHLDEHALRETIRAEERQNFQDQLEEARSRAEEDVASTSMQLELAQNEIERQQEIIRSLESSSSEAEEKDRRAAAAAAREAMNMETSTRYEEENQTLLKDMQAVKEENSLLTSRVQSLESENKLMKSQNEEQVGQLKRVLDEKTIQLSQVRRSLSQSASKEEYDKLRNQLLVIQRELYNVEEDEANGDGNGNNDNDSENDKNKNKNKRSDNQNSMNSNNINDYSGDNAPEQLDGLEAWFIKSSRQLKKELIAAKRTMAEQEKEIKALKETEERLGDALKDQRDLAAKLESDLLAGTNSKVVNYQLETQQSLPDLSATSPTASTTQSSGEYTNTSLESEKEKKAKDQQYQALNSMLQAVCSQRDRLRAQLEANEERTESFRKQFEESNQRVKTLEEDNLQLYQRIRFLQNYKVSERSTLISDPKLQNADLEHGAGNAVVLSAQGSARVGGLGRGVEHKYRNLYASDSNPLASFQKQESERVFQSMPRLERTVVTVFNAFLTRSRGRVFLVVYSAFLHLFILKCLIF